MNEIQIFNNPEFGEIRTLEENGKVLFCGVDVARALGYKDTTRAIKQHCREDGVVLRPVMDSLGRKQQANFITEGNLYRMTSGSELPSAEKFDVWIYDEVLPSLRKTGTYSINDRIEAATLKGAASVGCLIERTMKAEGTRAYEMAIVLDSLFKQSGISLPDCFIKVPEYEQMVLPCLKKE